MSTENIVVKTADHSEVAVKTMKIAPMRGYTYFDEEEFCTLCGEELDHTLPPEHCYEVWHPEHSPGAGPFSTCRECAEHPEQIPNRIRAHAAALRDRAMHLEQEWTQYRYERE